MNAKFLILVLGVILLSSCKKNEKQSNDFIIEEVAEIEETEELQLPYFNTPDFTPLWLSPATISEQKIHRIPEFKFLNQHREEVTNKTTEGKIYIADFFFTTCPTICLELTKQMHTLQEIYKNDPNVCFLSHTVMPWYDTVEKLNEYAKLNDVGPKWHLLTGKKEKIYDLARQGYFADDTYKETNDVSRFIHTENFILVDQKGYIRGVYNGTLLVDIKRIEKHIQMLKQESGILENSL